MVILYSFLPNLRSPESVGAIRKSSRAKSARALGADTNGPYVSDFAIVGPPVGRATRPKV